MKIFHLDMQIETSWRGLHKLKRPPERRKTKLAEANVAPLCKLLKIKIASIAYYNVNSLFVFLWTRASAREIVSKMLFRISQNFFIPVYADIFSVLGLSKLCLII